jgi:hypothetical protein
VGLTPAQKAFFESPEGVQFLHTLHVAALFVMCLCGGLGVAMVRSLLTLTGLHPLIACSDSTLLRARRAMIEAIGSWADSQGKTLGKTMAPKELLVALDENFHQGLMLVAMDAVSNFILVETFADKRDAESWASVLRASVASWPVRIVGLLGDEAKGLIRCAREQLRVLKGSDLFHVQHEICKGAAGLLRGLRSAAKARLEQAQKTLDGVLKAREKGLQRASRSGRPGTGASRKVSRARSCRAPRRRSRASRPTRSGCGPRYARWVRPTIPWICGPEPGRARVQSGRGCWRVSRNCGR